MKIYKIDDIAQWHAKNTVIRTPFEIVSFFSNSATTMKDQKQCGNYRYTV